MSLIDSDNCQLPVSGAEFTLNYDYNALDLIEMTSRSDAYNTEIGISSAINQIWFEIGSGNATAGAHLSNIVVFKFRIKNMNLNQDYLIKIENLYAYDANGNNISDHIKTVDGRIRLVEAATTTTTTTTSTTPADSRGPRPAIRPAPPGGRRGEGASTASSGTRWR